MASTVTITITINDRSAADSWLREVEAINQDYKSAMDAAAQCLQEMKGDASGDLVDQIADIGGSLMNAAQQTFEAIGAIAETVSKICDLVEDFQEGVKTGLKNLATKIFG